MEEDGEQAQLTHLRHVFERFGFCMWVISMSEVPYTSLKVDKEETAKHALPFVNVVC